jgi:phosphomannomutase/phosphoglucomutase
MFPKPQPELRHNSYAYETTPMVKPTGFREYDARWLYEREINLMGAQALGMGLGRLIDELGVRKEVVVGHDYRAYSGAIKGALTCGLMAAGAKVYDIGLLRPVRARRPRRRHGHRLAQRQRLDRRQDGRGAAGHFRA